MNDKEWHSLAILEEKTAELYEEILSRVEDQAGKLLLLNIILETNKHRRIFMEISGLKEPLEPQRHEPISKAQEMSLLSLEELKNRIRAGEDPKNVLIELLDFEKSYGEEHLMNILVRAKALYADKVKRMLLEKIIRDEEDHVKYVRTIIRILDKQDVDREKT